MLIQVGDAERIRDDAIWFSEIGFPTQSIRLELYENQVHAFHMYAPLHKPSRVALNRAGRFIQEQTGSKQFERPEVKHESVWIRDSDGFPVVPVTDVVSVIDDGAAELLRQGVWTLDMKSTSLFVDHEITYQETGGKDASFFDEFQKDLAIAETQLGDLGLSQTDDELVEEMLEPQ